MMDYENRPCPHCGSHHLIYNQYIGDSRCETCGEWECEETEEQESETSEAH